MLTAIVPDGREKTETRTAETDQDVRVFVQRHDGRRNIYYSVNPTKHAMRTKASKQDVASAEFVHADLDPRDDETPEDAKARYIERLAVFEPRPTAIVDTGNGIQALWRLDAPVPPDRFAEVEAASAGVINALGGDGGTHNVDRILRLPGTRNLPTKSKRKRGRVGCDAALLSFDGGAHPLDAFPAAEPRAAEPRRSAKIIPLPPIPAHLRERAARSTGRGVSTDPEDMLAPVDPAVVEAALAVIPSDYREVWYKVAAALYSAFDGSDEGFAIFDAWSRTTTRENYSEDSARRQWDNSAAFTDIHAGTIFHLADEQDPDWRDAISVKMPGREPGNASEAKLASPSTSAAEDKPKQGTAIKTKGEKLKTLIRSASDLRTKTFVPLRWIVPSYVPEGTTILAGRPKIGKSWLALDIAIAVATGGQCLGQACEQGDVLALFLEDTDRRIQRRMTAMLGAQMQEWPVRLQYATEWPVLTRGGLELIREWISSSESPRLVIVDVLQKVRGAGAGKESQYAVDYAAVADLQKLSGEAQLSIVGLHHQRKAGADDVFDTISGTHGLTGAADANLILETGQEGKVLQGKGRDLEEFNIAVRQDAQMRWQVLGSAEDVHRSEARSQIIEALRKNGKAMHLRDIATAVSATYENVKKVIADMHSDGEVERVGVNTGVYQLPKEQPELNYNAI